MTTKTQLIVAQPIATQLGAIAKGDRAAFAAVYRDQSPIMTSYATALLAGDRPAAEDVVGDAFLDIWNKAGSYAGTGSAQGWIRRIVRNKAIDWLRKQKEVVADLAADDHNAIWSNDRPKTPHDLAEQSSEAEHLRSALPGLSIEQREAVWLCYYENKSLADIAILCACPENTVKTRLFHARKYLKAKMVRA